MKKVLSILLILFGFVINAEAATFSVDPGMIGLHFLDANHTNPGFGEAGDNSFRLFFGNNYNNDKQLITYDIDVNRAAGSASVVISGLNGRVFEYMNFRDNATPIKSNVQGNITFNWSGLEFQTINGVEHVLGRNGTTGSGSINFTSDFFDGGSLSVALSPKGSQNNYVWGSLASATNPLYFIIGETTPNYTASTGFQNLIMSAWFMGDQSFSVAGNQYNLYGDFHGQLASDVPEPTTMLLLGAAGIMAPLRKKLKLS